MSASNGGIEYFNPAAALSVLILVRIRLPAAKVINMSKSPCIKVCEFEQEICLGCGRSRAEIKGWKRLDKAERRALLAEADMRLLALAATGRRKY